MQAAQRAISHEGTIYSGQFGQVKAHPACQVERDARSQMLMAIKALNLDVEASETAPADREAADSDQTQAQNPSATRSHHV